MNIFKGLRTLTTAHYAFLQETTFSMCLNMNILVKNNNTILHYKDL